MSVLVPIYFIHYRIFGGLASVRVIYIYTYIYLSISIYISISSSLYIEIDIDLVLSLYIYIKRGNESAPTKGRLHLTAPFGELDSVRGMLLTASG